MYSGEIVCMWLEVVVMICYLTRIRHPFIIKFLVLNDYCLNFVYLAVSKKGRGICWLNRCSAI
jgi:hypothetical protein